MGDLRILFMTVKPHPNQLALSPSVLVATLFAAASVVADPAQPTLINQFSQEERETLRRDIDNWSGDDGNLGTQLENRRRAFREKAEARFELADVDADGALDTRELELFNPRLLRHFNRIDTDQSGRITKAELAQSFRKHAELAGKNRPAASKP